MGKHKTDKVSQIMISGNNKAGGAPQAPNVGSEQRNQYR